MSQQKVRHISEEKAIEVAEAARQEEWHQPSFMKEMFLGRFRFDLIHPFPPVWIHDTFSIVNVEPPGVWDDGSKISGFQGTKHRCGFSEVASCSMADAENARPPLDNIEVYLQNPGF